MVAKGSAFQWLRCRIGAFLPGIVLLAVNWQSRSGTSEQSGADVAEIDYGRDDENCNWVAGGGIAGR